MRFWLFLGLFWGLRAIAAPAPDLVLAQEYRQQNVIGWAMSEKFDGVRAWWDGKQLISRQGNVFAPPPEFLRGFPPFALDGELFYRRGGFETVSAIVRANGRDWSEIRFLVFDAPTQKGGLHERLAVVQRYLKANPRANFAVVEQKTVHETGDIERFLREVEQLGGEGVMLRDPNVPYRGGRDGSLLKVKRAHDAECVVTRHHEGKGKYTGMMGALSCQNELGEFRIGSGFKDAQRRDPPEIGRVITYRYRGLTKKGLPRFPTFLRIRETH